MAGMLPGVEAARRRRFHQSSSLNHSGGSTTTTGGRSSFCLYATRHNFEITSTSFMRNSSSEQVISDDEKLESVAKEAKKRLDRRLQTHRKSSEIKR